MNAKNALHSHTNNYKRKFFFTRFVLFTSLPSYIVAEVFFACVYYGIVQCMQWIYLFLASIGTTNNLEANMQIFSPINIVVFLIGLGFVSLVACLEILTIIAITAYDYYRNDHIPLKTLMRFSYERLQSFLHLRSTPFLLFVFLFPKFHIGPSGLFALDIPPFILDELAKTPIYVVLFVLLFAFIGYIIYRSIFVLHYLFFERATIKRAFRMSFCLTKKLGYKKTLWIFCRTIFSVALLVIPIVAIVVALFRFIEGWLSDLGSGVMMLVDVGNYFAEFLFLGLSGAFLLANITIAYIKYAGFKEEHFSKRFHFLVDRPVFTPRWYNVRLAFQKKYPVIISAFLLLFSPVFLAVLITKTEYHYSSPIVISHRGASQMPDGKELTENTFSAILEAKYQQSDIIEIDVRATKDGVFVLSHDSTLKRLSGDKRSVSDLTYDEISQISLYGGDKIARLDQVLDIARDKNIQLLIEPLLAEDREDLHRNLVMLLHDKEMISKTSFHSRSLDLLKKFQKLEPHIPIGLIIFGGFGKFGSLPVDFFSLQETIVTRSMIQDIHKNEKRVFVWTVNNMSRIENYMKMGVDGIITDKILQTKQRISEVLEKSENTSPKASFRIMGYEFSF